MKMAKASELDIDAAGDLMALLNDIDSGYYPAHADDEDAPTFFDEDDRDHLRLFYHKVKALLNRAPGFPGRVIGGMCYVIMYDKNEIIDPNSDVIELHPRLQVALEAADRIDELERQIAERDAQAAPAVPKFRQMVQHVEGGIYEHIGTAKPAGQAEGGADIEVYRSQEGAIWYRFPHDFADRFTAIAAAPSAPNIQH